MGDLHMNDKLLSFLGICRRAGKLKIGAESASDSIKAKKASLIIFANDFSQNSAKTIKASALEHNIKTLTINRSKDEISPAVGKLFGVAAVEDEGFAKKLIEIIENELGGV
jgi:ribosomal protein L7Ae-like RNA K-turn-binding protein